MKVLGVRLDNVDHEGALQKVSLFLASGQHSVFTPNPEMLVDAQKDEYFKEVLNQGSLNITDGKGIEYMTFGKVRRIAGTDFFMSLCRLAEQMNKRVFLLGTGDRRTLERAKEKLASQLNNLNIVGIHEGISIGQEEKNGRMVLKLDEQENNDMIAQIALAAPDILFVGFGHGKQEKWIYEYLGDMPSVRVAMGIGGALDYISGNIKRAPRWMRVLGLEWLFRVCVQPHRIGRILKATLLFPFLYLYKIGRS